MCETLSNKIYFFGKKIQSSKTYLVKKRKGYVKLSKIL